MKVRTGDWSVEFPGPDSQIVTAADQAAPGKGDVAQSSSAAARGWPTRTTSSPACAPAAAVAITAAAFARLLDHRLRS